MVKIILKNMKQDLTDSDFTYKPKKSNLDKYKISFVSKKYTHIQFILFAKFINSIKLTQPELSVQPLVFDSNNIFPYNGIIYSCTISSTNPLYIEIDPLDLCTKIIFKKNIFTPLDMPRLNFITWDKIFVINLERRTDRKTHMENFFMSNGILKSSYEFIKAFDGQDPLIINKFIKKKSSIDNYQIITPGHFACLMSHLEVIKIAKNRGYKNIMVLEDDVSTNEKNFIKILNSIKIPNFDLLYLGGIMSKKKYFMNNWAWSGNVNIMGAYGYILSSSLYDKILNELENLDEYIDFYYMKCIQPNYKTIILNDVIKTDLTTSDTSNKSRLLIKRLNFIK